MGISVKQFSYESYSSHACFNNCNNSFFKFSFFFLAKLFFLKGDQTVLGRRLVSFSWTERFAFGLTARSGNLLNDQNDLRLRGMQERYFWLINTYKYFNLEVRWRTNILKQEYLRSWSFEACFGKGLFT